MILPGVLASAGSGSRKLPQFEITYKPTSGSATSDLSNAPFYVDFSLMPASFWDSASEPGISFRASQGGVEVPVDLVYLNPVTQTGGIFVKLTVNRPLGGTFKLWMVREAEHPVDSPLGAKAVWSAYVAAVHGAVNLERKSRTTFTVGAGASFNGEYLALSGDSNSFARINLAALGFVNNPWYSHAIVERDLIDSSNQSVLSVSAWQTSNTDRETLSFRSATQMGIWNSSNNWLLLTIPDLGTGVKQLVGYGRNAGAGRQVQHQLLSNSAATTATRPASANPNWILGAEDSSVSERLTGKIYFAGLRQVYGSGHAGFHMDNFTTPDWYSVAEL